MSFLRPCKKESMGFGVHKLKTKPSFVVVNIVAVVVAGFWEPKLEVFRGSLWF